DPAPQVDRDLGPREDHQVVAVLAELFIIRGLRHDGLPRARQATMARAERSSTESVGSAPASTLSDPSRRARTTAPRTAPAALVRARQRPRIQSTDRSKGKRSSGSFALARTTASEISPASGTPAIPTLARTHVAATISCSPRVRGNPNAWATIS